MALTLTIAGTNRVANLMDGTLKMKVTADGAQGTADFTLIDIRPADDATVVIADGATTYYSGHVRSTAVDEIKPGHFYCVVACQDDAVPGGTPGTAAFNISDTPNYTTTFPYRDGSLKYKVNSSRGASYESVETSGSFATDRPGLLVNTNIQITCANAGLAAASFHIKEIETTFEGRGVPLFTVTFGDSPIRLVDTLVTQIIGEATDPAGALATSLHAPHVVTFLPELPDAAYPTGDLAYLTSDGKVYRNIGDIWSAQVDGQDILVSSITAGAIQAGAIKAEALAAELVLASKIKTALSGARTEMDTAGLRAYDSGDNLVVNVPNDGTPVQVTGAIEASSLVSTATAELRGVNTLPEGSVTTLKVSTTDPIAAPTLTTSVPSLDLTTTPPQPGYGICYDPAGNVGGATATYWLGANPTVGNLLDVAYEYDATTGALLRTIQKTGTTTTGTTTLGSTSHVGDTWQATSGTSDSQIATPLTMPRDGTITKVSVYVSGYSGDATCRNAIWNTSGTELRHTGNYTAASKATSAGGSVKHDVALTSGYFLTSGTTFWAGFSRSSSGDGFWWDRDDGSGKTTKLGDGLSGDMTGITTDSSHKPNVYVTYNYEIDSSLEGSMTKIVGVARQGSYVWVLDSSGILYRYVQSTLAYVDKFDLSAKVTGTKANAGLFYDGTNLIIVTTTNTTASTQVRFVKVSTAGAWVSDHDATGLTVNGTTTITRGGYYVGGTFFIALSGSVVGVKAYNATSYAYWSDDDHGLAAEISNGVTDGPTDYSVGWAGAAKVWLFTTWVWSGTADIWVAYTWYDSVGTTHETAVGPIAHITGKRRTLSISTAVIPGAGGADEPNNVRVYAYLSGASAPAASSLKLQATSTSTTVAMTSFNSGGAAPPGSNGFSGSGTPAELKSVTGSTGNSTAWSLKGDGAKSGFLRFVSNISTLYSTTTTSTIARTHTTEVTAIPTDAVAVSVRLAAQGPDGITGRLQVFNYNDANIQAECFPGARLNQYSAGTAPFVLLGGTNNRQFDYSVTIPASGTTTYVIAILGYWTYNA